MKRPMVLLPPLLSPLLPLGAAQNAPTCKTVMADLERSAAATQSVTRTLTIRAGERELSHSVVQVVQGENGLEVTTLEQRGRLPPERKGDPGPQRSLLGLPPGLSCDGHTLSETEGGYELSLAVTDEANPVDTVVLEQQGDRLVPLGYTAAGSVTQFLFTTALGLSMSYRDWEFR